MELMPAAAGEMEVAVSRRLRRRSGGFRSLKLVTVGMEDSLPSEPVGVAYGVLENGLTYYVRSNTKPQMRAALALAVKVGSVVEEEEERGVAHIVEHLAFSATKKYTNHDIVKFLESIGAEFGACQNALTSCDETIYELLVPVDRPELLSQAISILAEFSCDIRVSANDLEKERGAVLEEYRGGRNAAGRMQEDHWVSMFEGSKYGERLPIGLEKVIRTVTPETVKSFYQKWYHPSNMAVVAVGDFPHTQDVVELIRSHFGGIASSGSFAPALPVFPVPSHTEPRISCFVESEASGSAVVISCKVPMTKMESVKDFKDFLVESMFHYALNQRFFKISHRKDPPFFSCSFETEDLVRPIKAHIITSSCRERGIIDALESMLLEVARVRLHGFSEREISIVRALMMSEIESAYLERDQMQSTSLRDECLQHFLRNELIMGIEFEAQLQKTLLPHISSDEVSKFAANFRTTCSCVMKTVEPLARVTREDLIAAVSRINALEDEQAIDPWDDEQVPEEIICNSPEPGSIVQQLGYPDIGITEILLSNGMRVCYKCTNFFDDQVVFTGFAYGGLSELSESEYISCSMASTIAGEIGIFGHRPSVLMDMLAGKRVEVSTKIGTYTRTFSGDCSPSDLETALQLVYQLFTTDVEPREEEVSLVMQMSEEAVRAQERDPYTAFSNRVLEINYGKSYFFRPIRVNDLKKVDPIRSCEYFNACFKDPSTFTMVVVGNIDPEISVPLFLRYLGGIPRPAQLVLNFNRDELKGLPFQFPTSIVRDIFYSPMVEAQCLVQLAFPAILKNTSMMEEIHYVGFLSKLLETKIMQILRFKHGQIYSVTVSVFLSGNKPSRMGDVRGDIRVTFSCDADISSKLVELALDEVSRLQDQGPSNEDVSTILEIEQRSYEDGLQENYYWLDRILSCYQSRAYLGDINASYQTQVEVRERVRKALTTQTLQSALQRILPQPCREQYTVVILMRKSSWFGFLSTFLSCRPDFGGRDVKILAGVVGAAVLVISLWRRYSRISLKA